MPDHVAPPRTRIISTCAATLLAALALLPLLGAKPLTDWDEAIYAEVAREMLLFGPLIPHWNYAVWLEKPPLAMGLTAALFHLFGVSAFTARVVSALSGIATIAILHASLARTRGLLTASLSSAILLGTFGFLHACHTGELDTLLALTCTLAVLGLARIPTAPRSGWLLFWTGFALAAMTKGAASIVLPLTALALAALPPRTLRLTRHVWPGLALFLAIVLPWHLAMLHRFGSVFLQEYLGFHVLTRSTHQIEGHTTSAWFYLKVLLVAAPPFVLLYPAALARALRLTPRIAADADLRPWAIFSVVTLVFYTVVQTRLPQYIVPAYPALALLTAVWLAGYLEEPLRTKPPAAFWIKRATLAAAVSGLMIALTTPTRKALHSAAPPLPGVAAPLDNKDSVALLIELERNPPTAFTDTSGPLLLWRPSRISSVAADVFYARRPIQQVQLLDPQPVPPAQPPDRYLFDPIPLEEAAQPGPRLLLLLDRTLVPLLPPTLTYTPVASHGSMEIGTLTARTR